MDNNNGIYLNTVQPATSSHDFSVIPDSLGDSYNAGNRDVHGDL